MDLESAILQDACSRFGEEQRMDKTASSVPNDPTVREVAGLLHEMGLVDEYEAALRDQVKIASMDDVLAGAFLKSARKADDEEEEEELKGGEAEKKKVPPSEVPPKALAKGIKEEAEHTPDKKKREEIALDHLAKDRRYYEKLPAVEKGAPKKEREKALEEAEEEVEGKEEGDGKEKESLAKLAMCGSSHGKVKLIRKKTKTSSVKLALVRMSLNRCLHDPKMTADWLHKNASAFIKTAKGRGLGFIVELFARSPVAKAGARANQALAIGKATKGSTRLSMSPAAQAAGAPSTMAMDDLAKIMGGRLKVQSGGNVVVQWSDVARRMGGEGAGTQMARALRQAPAAKGPAGVVTPMGTATRRAVSPTGARATRPGVGGPLGTTRPPTAGARPAKMPGAKPRGAAPYGKVQIQPRARGRVTGQSAPTRGAATQAEAAAARARGGLTRAHTKPMPGAAPPKPKPGTTTPGVGGTLRPTEYPAGDDVLGQIKDVIKKYPLQAAGVAAGAPIALDMLTD
jgi:hypothetical protein